MPDRPNVLLITADHLRHDALGCNGNPFVSTPNVDGLAARGVTFANSFTPNPICVPARASITTGNWSHVCTRTKANGGLIRDDQPRIAHHFNSHGYWTCAVGKLHYVPYAPPGQPRRLHGFQHAELCEEGRIVGQFNPTGEMRGLEDYHDYLYEVGWGGYERAHATGNNDVHAAPSPLPQEYHEEAWVADRAIANISAHLAASPDQPFFTWASFTKPHPPYDPPRPWDTRYDPREIPKPRGSYELLADRDPMLRREPVMYGWDKMSPEAVQVARAHYFGMVSFQDAMIGRVLSSLQQAGVLENTIIVYTADHGDLLGDYGCFFKCNMLDGSVRVPLVIAGPGVERPGEAREQLCGLVDVLPTLADLTGTSLSHSVMGKSLAPALGDPAAASRECFVSQSLPSPQQRYMLCTHEWKYVYHEIEGVEELYCIPDDPEELRNLAAEQPARASEMRGALLDWCRENGDEEMLQGDDLKVSPLEAAGPEGFQGGRLGWRKY